MSRSATRAWLAIIESIPQTQTHSLRELHFTQAFDRYVKTLSSHALLHDSYLPEELPTIIPTPPTVTPTPAAKPRKVKPSGKKSSNGTTDNTPTPGTPAAQVNVVTPATPNTGKPRINICANFASTRGCARRDGTCRFQHVIPPRDSAEHNAMKTFMASRGLSPSPAFLRGESE